MVLIGSAVGVLAPLRLLAAERSAEVGKPAPQFRVSDAEGRERKLSDFADRPVVLETITDPNVPPLPPHITLKQAKAYGSAILRGDTDTPGIIKQTVKQILA